MRILVDECLDWRLSRAFPDDHAVSVQKMGWSGITNGKLLALAIKNKFDVFLTADRNLTFQQNLIGVQIAIVVLEGAGIRLQQTLPLIPKVIELFGSLKPGVVVRVTQ